MEHAIGKRITLEVQEALTCDGCIFLDNDARLCIRPSSKEAEGWMCSQEERTDRKTIIYKEVKD